MLNAPMSRGQFLRVAGIMGGAVAAAGLFGSGAARAHYPDANIDASNPGKIIVYPTNDSAHEPEFATVPALV